MAGETMRLLPEPLRATLSTLPRDARDTLFMLAVIAWTLMPHLLRLSPAIGGLCALVLLWRARLAWRQHALPGRWAVIAVLVLACGLTWLSEHTLLGKDAGVTLLVVLMTLKTLELRARRDALVVFFLGFFLVLTQFLYSQGLLTALAMGLAVWGWLTALSLAHMPAGRPTLGAASWVALKAAAVGTPVMVALFLLFPRIGPLWAMPNEQGRSGLSDQLELGDVAELVEDESVAFRVRFTARQPSPQQLYFRGPVLTDYDGKRWQTSPMRPFDTRRFSVEPAAAGEPRLDYEMTVEPMRLPWLPLLEHTTERPQSLPDGYRWPETADAQGQWRLRDPLGQRVRLQASARPQARHGTGLTQADQISLRQLPPGVHPRTRAWARDLADQPQLQGADATALAQAVLAHIRNAGYSYTLSPGQAGPDPVDSFWLDRRSGFCEHYAASLVIILRTLGIPSRIVTGYQGSDPTLVDGYYVVRQSHAHAWAEYWQAGHGWIRIDPTGAVAPDRIQRSRSLQPPPGLFQGMVSSVNPDLHLQLRQWFEALDNRWNQWVLGYGAQQQTHLLDRLGLDSSDLWSLAQALIALIGTAALGGMAWIWWDTRHRSPWARLRQLIERELQRLGLNPQPHHTPAQLARLLRTQHGAAAEPASALLMELEALRYARPPDKTASARNARRNPQHHGLTAWQARFLAAMRTLRASGG